MSGRWLQIEVSDNGIGISKENLPKIFDPFFTTREVGQGVGLGLSQVSGIVIQHGGHITVDSTLNMGTTVTMLLPLGRENH